MKFSTREDVEAPLSTVYARFADHTAWERMALRRGVDVSRVDRMPEFAPGMAWVANFDLRGKRRKLTVKLVRAELDEALDFQFSAATVEGTFDVGFMALSPRRTRVNFVSEIKPRNLAARLVLQSMRLARGKLERRFETRIAQLCNEIEERHRTGGGGPLV